MSLGPDKTVTKLLLSSTSRFVGEYRCEDTLLTHAWAADRHQVFDGPLSRNFFVLSFAHPEFKKDSVSIPDYTPTGDLYCAYLSILFGKRFENHGCLESHGHFRIPSHPAESRAITPWLPFNSHRVRADFPVPLDLSELGRLTPLLKEDTSLDPKFVHILNAAGGFYARAIRIAEDDAETAYLSLITSGEILSNFFEYDNSQLLDQKLIADLETIALRVEGGANLARRIQQRLFQVRRRFHLTVRSLLSDDFFANHESTEDHCALNSSDIDQRIKAAYDLRSRYVHTGIPFGGWVGPVTRYVEEVQLGNPVIEDKEVQKIIARAPTLVGLERVVRFCLFRFIQDNGAYVA